MIKSEIKKDSMEAAEKAHQKDGDKVWSEIRELQKTPNSTYVDFAKEMKIFNQNIQELLKKNERVDTATEKLSELLLRELEKCKKTE